MASGFSRTTAIDIGVLTLAAIAALGTVLRNGFVNWDDPTVLVENIHLGRPGVVAYAFSTTLIGHYQPLAWLVWSTAASLFGVSPAPLHALSLAGHAVNGILVYAVMRRLVADAPLSALQRRAAGLLAALTFLLHPTAVETVAWASAFPYVLSLTLLLLAFLAYLNRRPVVSIACYAASLLARPSAIGFPVVLLAVDMYPLARLQDRKERKDRRGAIQTFSLRSLRSWRSLCSSLLARPVLITTLGRLALEKIPFFALALAASVMEWQARDVATFDEVGLGARLTMAATSPFVYLGRVLLPVRLSPLNPLPISPELHVVPLVLGLIGLAAVTLVAWMRRRSWPLLAATWIGYVVLIAPIAGLTPSGLQATADRYLYVPSVVISLAAGAAVSRLLTSRLRGEVGALAAAAVIATLGVATWRQAHYWRNSIALWTRAAELDPRNDVATYNLAIALAEAGRDEEAIGRYEQTLTLVPDHDLARHNLAVLQASRAEREADRLAAAGRVDEASEQYGRALALDAKRPHARAAHGMLLMRRGRFHEAAAELRLAIEEGVKDEEVPNALAFALVHTGDSAEAARVLGDGVAAHPDNVNLKHNLARVLATAPDPRVRNAARAVQLAEEVCERTGNRDPRALDTLAAAYAAAGRPDLARATLSRAVARARELGDAETAAEIAAHEATYGHRDIRK